MINYIIFQLIIYKYYFYEYYLKIQKMNYNLKFSNILNYLNIIEKILLKF